MRGRDVIDEMESRFDELRRELMGGLALPMPPPLLLPGGGPRSALADLVETEKEYVLTVEVPGVEKGDIALDIEEDAVHVRARKTTEEESRKGDFVRHERSGISFEKHVGLPEEVSPEGARATFSNGVLEVTLPKKSPSERKARRVDIA